MMAFTVIIMYVIMCAALSMTNKLKNKKSIKHISKVSDFTPLPWECSKRRSHIQRGLYSGPPSPARCCLSLAGCSRGPRSSRVGAGLPPAGAEQQPEGRGGPDEEGHGGPRWGPSSSASHHREDPGRARSVVRAHGAPYWRTGRDQARRCGF